MLSRMRTNITLYDFAPTSTEKRKAGRPRKYGKRLGSVDDCATKYKEKAQAYTVFLYGKKREVQAYSQTVMLQTQLSGLLTHTKNSASSLWILT